MNIQTQEPPSSAGRTGAIEACWLWQWAIESKSPFEAFERLPPLPEDPSMAYSFAVDYHYRFIALCLQLEIGGFSPPEIFRLAEGARRVLSDSVFIRHLQTWPHSYPGDWEVVEHIVDGANKSEELTWAWYLEQSALHTPAASQHRNKVRWQAEAIAKQIRKRPDSRILSLACGGSRDVDLALRNVDGRMAQVVLNDAEERALALSENRLKDRIHELSFIHGNAVTAARRLRDEKPFDLVLAGGLFDYLPDRPAAVLLKSVAPRLSPDGGAFLFTNIGRHNPCRPWMEYAANWRLIERSPEDLLRLCEQAGLPSGSLAFDTEETGLTLLATAGGSR